jgi:hypothetical protein
MAKTQEQGEELLVTPAPPVVFVPTGGPVLQPTIILSSPVHAPAGTLNYTNYGRSVFMRQRLN